MKRKPLKVAFLDRDGTLIYEPPNTKQIDSLDRLKILPGVIDGLKDLRNKGFMLVMVSNQDGLGTRSFSRVDFELVQKALLNELKEKSIVLSQVFICPHVEVDNCVCRKPKTGLVTEFLSTNTINKEKSLMIGDRASDATFARNLGIRFYRMRTNGSFPQEIYE